MEKLFRDIPLFVEAAKQKSLTRAAESLDMPLSTLSRRILAMEKELGLPLFYRSARKLELTQNGQALYERCRFVVAEAGAALEEAVRNMKSPKGRVRLSMPLDLYHGYLSGALSAFALLWPDIHMQVHLSQRWVDLLTEPFDLDIRIGPLPDSDLIVRKIGSLKPGLYASPKLLEFYAEPQKPADLADLPCIGFVHHGDVWSLSSGEVTEHVTIRAVHTVNTPSVALEFMLAGLGIGWLAVPKAVAYEESGQLLRLLPDWRPPGGVDISVVTPARQMPHRVRLFVDFLATHFADMQ
ncbi:LysR family transcriptional regulator [Desulfovibrio sp. OttesenSCG-928-M14]|nr:LysR family transcriptional regulator [Desulfovibrio sp. OttesenSCG-928-M14]